MVNMKMGPHMEHEPVKTDLQIVEQVIKEHSSSRSSTFLSSVGVSSNSRRTSTSNARIKELEARLAIQEQQAVDASAKYQEEMEKRMQAQDDKFQELERKQEEQLEAVNKASEQTRLAFEKRQQEMDAMLSYLFRTSQQSQGNANP